LANSFAWITVHAGMGDQMGTSALEDADASNDVTPEAVLDARLKAMQAAMQPSSGTRLPDLGSLPVARRGDAD
jgi:hypothetical protein